MCVASVMSTLMEVQGRHSCRAVEASCIEYMASDPAVYAAVKATDDYKELKESCCSFLLEVAEKVAAVNMVHNMCSNAPSSSGSRLQTDASTLTSLEVVEGAHEFKIPCFLFVQRRHGVGKEISSEAFQVGGYSWKIKVYPSSSSEKAQGHISVYAELLTDPGTEGINVTLGFKLDDHSGQSRHLIKWLEKTFITKSDWGYAKFVTIESAKSWHLARDASLTIRCDVAITKNKKVYISTNSTTSVSTGAIMPPSDIASHLKQLLVTEHGSDIRMAASYRFTVHGVMVAVFNAVLHFIYTDELPPIQDLARDGAAQDEVMIAEDMLVEAHWFGQDRMKAMCKNLLAGFIHSKEDALRTLEHVSDLQFSDLRDYCNQYIASTKNFVIADSSELY
ncbi:Speckle-type POZ protein [Hordeum vulgare]|nr:Speckle-type POZ protein [Hordeum vulgare]